jgi:hypothetical protein
MQSFIRFLFGLIAAAVILLLGALVLEPYIASDEITIFVKNQEKITTEDGEIYFLVYTDDEIFENRDNMFHKKDETLQIFKRMKKNNKYRVRVVGYDFGGKIPFFSKYRNITAVLKGPKTKKN